MFFLTLSITLTFFSSVSNVVYEQVFFCLSMTTNMTITICANTTVIMTMTMTMT